MTKAAPPVSTAVEALLFRARNTPESLAFAVGDEAVTYGELHDRVLSTCAGLAELGIERGDRCALILGTGLHFIRTLFAVQMLGATPVALNPSLSAEALAGRLRWLRCRLAVVEGDERASLQAAIGAQAGPIPAPRAVLADSLRRATTPSGIDLPRVGPDDTAYIQVTSGTTGEPKGAMVSHRSLDRMQRSSIETLDISDGDVFASWLPLYHDLGLVRFLLGPVFHGCPCHLLQPSLLNLEAWLRTVSRVRATITASPDFGYRIAARMVDPEGIDLSSLKAAINGGEPVRMSTIEAFELRFGVPGAVRPGYGLAEVTLAVSSMPLGEPLRCDASGQVSCGPPVPVVEIRIVDDDGRERPPGERGEIAVRGDALFSGYFDDPEATARVLRDGWLLTGDIGAVDSDGYLYVHGRRRSMIKAAGATLAPREAEEAADSVSGVRFSAAVGLPDERLGTDAVVLVAEVRRERTSAPGDRRDLAREVARRVSAAIGVRPGRVLLVRPRTIPKTENGKIRHLELLRHLESGTLDSGAILYEFEA